MQSAITKFKSKYGYEPELSELYSLYAQGEIALTDAEENELLEAVGA